MSSGQYIANHFSDFVSLVTDIAKVGVTADDKKSAKADLGYCVVTLGNEYVVESDKETRHFECVNDAMEYILRRWWQTHSQASACECVLQITNLKGKTMKTYLNLLAAIGQSEITTTIAVADMIVVTTENAFGVAFEDVAGNYVRRDVPKNVLAALRTLVIDGDEGSEELYELVEPWMPTGDMAGFRCIP